MRVRSAALLIATIAAMGAITSSAMGLQILSTPVGQIALGTVTVQGTLNNVLGVCPAQPAPPGSTANVCTVPPVAGIGATCAKTTMFANSASGCILVTPVATVACGGNAIFGYVTGGGSQLTDCGVTLSGRLVGLHCESSADKFGSLNGCTVVAGTPLVSYIETIGNAPYYDPPAHTETLTIGSLKYQCVNDACQLLTS